MKWVTLIKDFKEKVGFSQASSSAPTTSASSVSSALSSWDYNAFSDSQNLASSSARDTHELELDFNRFWEEFRSSNSEKEKEAALDQTVDAFCRLAKQHVNVAQLFAMLVETHLFSFVVGRAFVTDIEKLKTSRKTRSLDVAQVFEFFSEVTKDGITPGSNLLTAVEILVSGPVDKQSLLDSGIFCCLIHILNALLDPDISIQRPSSATNHEEPVASEIGHDGDVGKVRQLEVEGNIVHIMKGLASHPSAAQSLIEDESLQILFEMVSKGSLIVFSRYKEGLVPLHNMQLHRHAMQILGLLLVNDNGSTASYIRKHNLIKVLLLAVKDFDPDSGDSAYTMGIVDLLLECVELSNRPDAGSIRLKEDIHNAHGYQFLVQFALTLSKMAISQGLRSFLSNSFADQDVASDGSQTFDDGGQNSGGQENATLQGLSPTLSRLLDVLVCLAQTGSNESLQSYGSKGSKSSQNKPSGYSRSHTSSFDWRGDEAREKDKDKIKDLEAVQMLQDIFLKATSRELQAEVLNRMFKIFSSHLDNYNLCQKLRTVPLFILNMAGFPSSLQEIILKILEYVVTVVNCVPEQELLSLCCLLQQPITSELKKTILSFFVKLLSFDQQYKKVLREVGVLEVLLDDLKQHRILGPDQQNVISNQLERKSNSTNVKRHLDNKDVIITSTKLVKSGSGTFPIFDLEATIPVAWDCLVSIVKKSEVNQASFRSANGVTAILPFLVSDEHRPGVVRILSCLIIEDVSQAHPEELGALVEILKSGIIINASGAQYRLSIDAKCDIMGALQRILGTNHSVQKVFGEATGFSLLLTTLHEFQSEGGDLDQPSLNVCIKVFTYLLRVVTVGVSGNAVNRVKLHEIICSQTFSDLLSDSGLLCAEHEKQVIQLMLELALEIVIPPSSKPEGQAVDMQLELLDLIEKLASAGPFNQENLTSVGCVELLLETVHPFLLGSSPLLSYALKIVEVLGSYRLFSSELRTLVKYILQLRRKDSGHIIIEIMEKLILKEDTISSNIPLAPFVEMDMSKIGHAAIQVSLGERSWPPAAGYSFVCWFQFQNFLNSQSKEADLSKAVACKKRSGLNGKQHARYFLRLFSVVAADNDNTTYAEVYLQDDGVLTLATSNNSFLSFSGLELEEGRWHHLAVVHSKPNALAGLFQASVAYVYLNGKLRHSGKLGYSPSPPGKQLQVIIGTSAANARVSDLTWKLRSSYLFEEVLPPGSICFMHTLGRGYRGLFQDTDLLQFVPNQACGGGSLAILDSLDADSSLSTNGQRLDANSKQEDQKVDGSGIVWDLERLGNLSLQLSGKKLIFAFDGTSTEFIQSTGCFSMLNLVDPVSAAASPIGGIPRFGRLYGDTYICKPCMIGETIRPIGGMEVILALIEAAETKDMLHMALTLLACALHQNHQNRGDVEVPVLEKLVILLGVILEDGFLSSELESVVRFVIMTFDPPGLVPQRQIMRESMGKHVIVRNMLLEMIIDLQVTIKSEELLEQWHKVVSSKLMTFFLDEAVHPTSMRWVMTLLGVCLTSSPTFALKFRTSGGYQGLAQLLPSFYDSPDIYYILFCLIFGKPVYPRLPEVRMLDFHALIPNDGSYVELKFVELLDSVIAMVKSTFDRLIMQSMHIHQTGNLSQFGASLVAELVDGNSDMAGELQGEALMHKTYAARLMGGEALAPAAATSVLRFMVDSAKMCPPFTAVCRRSEFLESCIDLYFSCVRAAHAVKIAKELSAGTEEKPLNDCDDTCSSQNTFSSLPNEQEQSVKTSISVGSFPKALVSTSSEDMAAPANIVAMASWLGSSNHIEAKSLIAATPSDLSISAVELDPSSELKSSSHDLSTQNAEFAVTSKLLLDINDSGYGGGPCSAGATAVLDLIAEVLSDLMTEQLKAPLAIENILESVPLNVDAESVLLFQGLCLTRFMNFLERRLLRDDEEDEKKLDKSRWSSNLDALCWMIVDRVYMGAFPQPSAVLKSLEFLLSMLQLANKDGRIEGATPGGKGFLSITRGSRQLEAYINSILKNTNRMILFCFLPSFLISIGEEDLLSRLGLVSEPRKRSSPASQEDPGIDISTVLQLLVAHKRIIFCPSNTDTDLNCCLCVNLISLLCDERRNVQNMGVDVIKYLLVHRRVALEDLLVSKPSQGQQHDVLHGGFDKLLTKGSSEFFEWYQNTEEIVNKLLEQCAGIMWMQYIAGSAKFPGVRIKGMEGHRKREVGRKSREAAKLDMRHWEQVNERRYALELVRDAMSTVLRIVRQDKYGWVLHAESEWQSHLQQLVHERGIFPLCKAYVSEEPEWQLCPIEGPYRMRKKLERNKLKIDSVENILDDQFKSMESELCRGKYDNGPDTRELHSEHCFQGLTDSHKQNNLDVGLYDPLFNKLDGVRDAIPDQNECNDDKASSINEASLYSALEIGAKSSAVSVPTAAQERSDLGSPRPSVKDDDVKIAGDKYDKELHDNGEFLIRPFLEPYEKIRFKYNCERVVGLDKHDGVFLIGESCLYVIENFYIDDSGCFCEKESEHELSVIDQALGVKKTGSNSVDFQPKSNPSWSTTVKSSVGGKAWAYSGGAWGKEKVHISGNLPHLWRMWKLNSVHEILKRDYQLRPVAIEIFSMDGCNDLLVFHKKEREEVFRNLVAMNLPRNSMLDTTISGSSKQENNEGSRLFKMMAKSFSKRWQNGEISNFQYLMHLNTLAGRGYSDLTQYPVFPWVLADYESENLNLSDPKTFRRLDKPMGCQTPEGEDEFRKRYESWDDPEVPKFHYGSHYSSAGIVLFYLLRLPPFSAENQKLQGGQFDHADRLFNSVKDTWLSAAGKGNTSDVKELIPEFFYMPEFLENRFNLDLGEKQSGEKVGDVILPPWAKGSTREFISKHREALESDYVSENLHHWIDLIFGYKQRGKAAEESVNVFYHYTYEGSVDIDSVTDPALKASILAQINHFGQTPKQLFLKPHLKRRIDRKLPPHPLKHSTHLMPHEIRKSSSPIMQIVSLNDKILFAGTHKLLKPRTYTTYVAWGFPDLSLRFMSYDQDRLISTHENLHGGNQLRCAGVSDDGQILVTGADDGLVNVWRVIRFGSRALWHLQLEKPLCGHTAKVTCLQVSQPYMLIVSGSDDCTVIIWDLSSMVFVRQLPKFPAPVSAIFVSDLTGEIVTAAGILLAVWSINGDCLAMIKTSQLPSDSILSVTSSTFSDWLDTNWYVTGHQSGAVKVWQMVHSSDQSSSLSKSASCRMSGLYGGAKEPEYRLVLHKVLKFHKYPVTALHLTSDLKQLLSGDSGGHLLSWTLPDESMQGSLNRR
ncbi:hypothetical protein K1719_037652 [Acacia pycnantha]|nr:hypothetical protein K1719_037652 [Acacia pycnantha]